MNCNDTVPTYLCPHENRKVSRKIEELEEDCKELKDKLSHHETSLNRKWQANMELSQRLTELEEANKEFLGKIKELELFQDITRLHYEIAAKNTRPHKCPVCLKVPLAEMKIQITSNGNNKLIFECHACEGTGIVWG
jgi:formate dehydrogenase maturation protein FdhE